MQAGTFILYGGYPAIVVSIDEEGVLMDLNQFTPHGLSIHNAVPVNEATPILIGIEETQNVSTIKKPIVLVLPDEEKDEDEDDQEADQEDEDEGEEDGEEEEEGEKPKPAVAPAKPTRGRGKSK